MKRVHWFFSGVGHDFIRTGNRLLSITYPGGSTATFTYDYRGRRISATDQNGKTTSYTHDDADRLTSVTDAASNVTHYSYDTENNVLSITDANGHATWFSYDAFGRVTQTTQRFHSIKNCFGGPRRFFRAETCARTGDTYMRMDERSSCSGSPIITMMQPCASPNPRKGHELAHRKCR